MDRFKPPELHEEPIVSCANCASSEYYDHMLEDERTGKAYCTRTCFEEWASDNFEAIADYYFNDNIY